MPIDSKAAEGIAKLAGAMPEQGRVLELAMLAGNGLASTLAKVRVNQAGREATRAKLKHGPKSPELARNVAIARAAEQMSASIDAEIARLSLEPPIPREGEVAVYGYVREQGKPACGLTVSLVDVKGERTVETRTAADGSFALTGTGPGPLGLLVRKGDTVLSTDEDPWYTPARRAYYRLVELAGRKEPKPGQTVPPKLLEPPVRGETKPDRSGYGGLTLNQALLRLDAEKRKLARVILTPSPDDDGHVIRATMDSRGGAVTLEVGVRDRNSDRLDMLAVLMAHEPVADRIGIGTIEQARTSLREAEMESLQDAQDLLELSDASLARKAKIGKGQQGKVLRELLSGALAKLETR